MSNISTLGGTGPAGPAGSAATVAVGTTSTLAPGAPATAANVGSPSAAVLNFGIPAGAAGSNGAATTVAVGSVSTLSPGASATVVNAGTSAAAVLNFGIPAGSTGATGPAGPTTVGAGSTGSATFGTAQQAADPSKPSFISTVIQTIYAITVGGVQADSVELRWGPVQATVANGTGGVAVPGFAQSLTGITLSIGMGTTSRSQLCALVPAGYFWALRRLTGSTATIVNVTDTPLG